MVVKLKVTDIGAEVIEFLERNGLLLLTPNGNAVFTSDILKELETHFNMILYINNEVVPYYDKKKSDGTDITRDEIRYSLHDYYGMLKSGNLMRLQITYEV